MIRDSAEMHRSFAGADSESLEGSLNGLKN